MFAGRKRYLDDLASLWRKQTSSLVACRGRRRIGKSRLFAEFARRTADRCIELSGLPPRRGMTNADQLAAFSAGLAREKAEAERKAREHGGVQLWEGGPYWAGTNIGADKPEDYGLYFWWGDTVGYYRRKGLVWDKWVASDGSSRNFEFSEDNAPTWGEDDATLRREGWVTSAGVLAPEHDAAHVHWGSGWRMPTDQELGDLRSKCDWMWTTVNGVEGYAVRGRGVYAGAGIFLPAAGCGIGTSLSLAGSHGYYWASVPYFGNYNSWHLYFSSAYCGMDDYYRYYGQSVRPVLGAE